MDTRLASVPRPICKYYKPLDLEIFIQHDFCDENLAELLQLYASSILNLDKLSLLGWAQAKPKYLDDLSEYGLGVLFIVKDSTKDRFLVSVNDGVVEKITVDKIQEIIK